MARLLIIEDDPDTQDIYRTILEHHGHTVTVADDGREGVRCATSEQWDLVILDIGLPQMSGTEVLHRLRSTDGGPDPKVLVVSAHGETMEAWEKVRSQVTDILTKPVGPNELMEEVERCLAEDAAEDRAAADAAETEVEVPDAPPPESDPLLLDAEDAAMGDVEELENGG